MYLRDILYIYMYISRFLGTISPPNLSWQVVQMTKDSLTALGLRNGAAHTEPDPPGLYSGLLNEGG